MGFDKMDDFFIFFILALLLVFRDFITYSVVISLFIARTKMIFFGKG